MSCCARVDDLPVRSWPRRPKQAQPPVDLPRDRLALIITFNVMQPGRPIGSHNLQGVRVDQVAGNEAAGHPGIVARCWPGGKPLLWGGCGRPRLIISARLPLP